MKIVDLGWLSFGISTIHVEVTSLSSEHAKIECSPPPVLFQCLYISLQHTANTLNSTVIALNPQLVNNCSNLLTLVRKKLEVLTERELNYLLLLLLCLFLTKSALECFVQRWMYLCVCG